MEKRIILLSLIVMAVFASCKTSREAAGTDRGSSSERKILEQAIAAQPEFSSLDMKRISVSISLGSSSYSSPAICRIIRDSVIHLSAQPFLGIEMVVAQFNKSGFVVLDKLRKVAYKGDYSQFSERFGIAINYSIVESLITNRLFVMEANSSVEKSLKPAVHSGVVSLNYENELIRQQFELAADHRIRKATINTREGRQQFSANYDEFTNQDLIYFPYTYSVQLTTATRKVELGVKVSRLVVNEMPVIPEISLQGYRIGDLESLLKR